MRRDTESDIVDYRPSLRQCSESNYWSDNNICQTPSATNTHLWNISFDKIDQSSEEKDHTISNEQLTAGMDKKQNDGDKKSKKVQINEAANTVQNVNTSHIQSDSQNFAPGSNQSPSLLADTQNNVESKQTDSVNITGQKRQSNQSLPSQNGTEQTSPPPRKRQRKSASSKSDNKNDELSHQQLQAIQNKARDEFQAQIRREGLYSQFNEFDTYNQDHENYHSGFNQLEGLGMDMQYAGGHNDYHGDQNNNSNNRNNNYNNNNSNNRNNNYNNNNSNNQNRNNNNNNSSAGRQNQNGAGGFPGGDPSDDDNDDDGGDKKRNNENGDDQDSDSQSEDSDDNDAVKGITVNTGNANNPINQVDALLKQNEELQKQLKQSNNRISDLMTQLPNNVNNNDNNNNNNNINVANNQSSMNQINVYQELIKQQQLQMSQLMRYAINQI